VQLARRRAIKRGGVNQLAAPNEWRFIRRPPIAELKSALGHSRKSKCGFIFYDPEMSDGLHGFEHHRLTRDAVAAAAARSRAHRREIVRRQQGVTQSVALAYLPLQVFRKRSNAWLASAREGAIQIPCSISLARFKTPTNKTRCAIWT